MDSRTPHPKPVPLPGYIGELPNGDPAWLVPMVLSAQLVDASASATQKSGESAFKRAWELES
jgi:hypothetical protein